MSTRVLPASIALVLALAAIACGELEERRSSAPGTVSAGLAAAPVEAAPDFAKLAPAEAWARGVQAFQGRDFELALAAFERAAGESLEARVWATEAALRADRAEDALAHAQALTAAGHRDGQFLLGLALERLGRYDEARTAYEHAIAEEPNDPAARNNLALTHYMQRDFAAARAALDAILELPGVTDHDVAVTLSNLSELLALEGELDAAARYLEQAHELAPGEAYPYFGRAVLADVRGDTVRALFLMQEGLDLDPDGEVRFATLFTYPDQAAHFDGLQHRAAGMDDVASEDFRRMLELPVGWEALAGRAKAHLGELAVEGQPTAPEQPQIRVQRQELPGCIYTY